MCLDGTFSFNHTCLALSKPLLLPISLGIISSFGGLSFMNQAFLNYLVILSYQLIFKIEVIKICIGTPCM